MADTPVLFQAPSGASNVTIELYPRTSDSIANGAGGDAGTEQTNAKTWYLATVAHAISGWHKTVIKVDGTPIGGSWIYMEDDTDQHECEEAPHRLYDGGDRLAAITEKTGFGLAADQSGVTIGIVTAIAESGRNSIADAVLIRAVQNVEDTADKYSLAGLILFCTNYEISGNQLTAKKPSDDSEFQAYTLTSDAAADPVTGVS